MKTCFAVTILALSLAASALAADAGKAFQMPRAAATNTGPAQQQETPLDSYEFNGYMKLEGKTKVSVTDTKAKKSYWLTLDGPAVNGVRLQTFLRDGGSIIIASGGIIKQLDLKKPKIEKLRVVENQPSRPNVPGMATSAAPSSNRSQTRPAESDEEVRRRMQKVADEIRRRRAERRAMIEQRQKQSSGN